MQTPFFTNIQSISAIGLALLLTTNAGSSFAENSQACASTATIQALQTHQVSALLKNAPTLNHAWQDKKITLEWLDPKTTANGCEVTMQLTLPQQDLDEANADLSANPAKRILLGAQGYAVPEQTQNQAPYYYQVAGSTVTPANDKNQAYQQLMSNVEYVYQNLAQLRTVVKADASNTEAWPETLTTNTVKECSATFSARGENNLNAACACRTDALKAKLAPRQFELVQFVTAQPYSAATGVLASYSTLSNTINDSCGLVKK